MTYENSTFKKVLNSLVLILIATAIAGCAKSYIKLEAIEYNKALAQNVQEEILLNAIRASKRKPLSFAAIGDLTGNIHRNASISANLPFSNGSLNSFTISPKIDADYNNTAKFANLNTAEFFEKIRAEIKPSDFKFYLDNNWPRDVLFMTMIHRIDVSKSLNFAIWEQVSIICEDPKKRHLAQCEAYGVDHNRIKSLSVTQPTQEERISCRLALDALKSNASGHVTYINNPRQQCGFLAFRMFIHAMNLSGFSLTSKKVGNSAWVNQEREVKKKNDNTIQTKTTQVYKSATSAIVFAQSNNAQVLTVGKKGSANVHLRSPAEIINYLGRIIAAKHYLKDAKRYTPTVRYGIGFSEVELFNVERGYVANSVVKITDEEHQRFSIPRPDYGSASEDRSMNVLALLTELISRRVNSDATSSPQQIVFDID